MDKISAFKWIEKAQSLFQMDWKKAQSLFFNASEIQIKGAGNFQKFEHIQSKGGHGINRMCLFMSNNHKGLNEQFETKS